MKLNYTCYILKFTLLSCKDTNTKVNTWVNNMKGSYTIFESIVKNNSYDYVFKCVF